MEASLTKTNLEIGVLPERCMRGEEEGLSAAGGMASIGEGRAIYLLSLLPTCPARLSMIATLSSIRAINWKSALTHYLTVDGDHPALRGRAYFQLDVDGVFNDIC